MLKPFRGGSWLVGPRGCRSAFRFHLQPVNAVYVIGFRVVCLPREAPTQSPSRSLLRGGSWDDYPGYCRSAYRDLDEPDLASISVGFRVVCLPH